MVFLKNKRLGRQTVAFTNPPSIAAGSCVVGQKEGEGPLRKWFDYISDDSYFGQSSWEKAESVMLSKCFALCCDKARIPPSDIQYLFAGDLLNQCAGSTFAARDLPIPYFGVYGACSTMAESLSLAAMTIDGGYADTVCAMTSSHFCSAERQFRLPLEYGGQRTPTAQWTVTGAGALLLTSDGEGPYVTHVTTGRIRDAGVTDANNMGAAMAPAAYETPPRSANPPARHAVPPKTPHPSTSLAVRPEDPPIRHIASRHSVEARYHDGPSAYPAS